MPDAYTEILPAAPAGKMHILRTLQFVNFGNSDQTVTVSARLKQGAVAQEHLLLNHEITDAEAAVSGLVDAPLLLQEGLSIEAISDTPTSAKVLVSYAVVPAAIVHTETVLLTDANAAIIDPPAAGKLRIIKMIQFANIRTDDTAVAATAQTRLGSTDQFAFVRDLQVTREMGAKSGLVSGDLVLLENMRIRARADANNSISATVSYLEIDA